MTSCAGTSATSDGQPSDQGSYVSSDNPRTYTSLISAPESTARTSGGGYSPARSRYASLDGTLGECADTWSLPHVVDVGPELIVTQRPPPCRLRLKNRARRLSNRRAMASSIVPPVRHIPARPRSTPIRRPTDHIIQTLPTILILIFTHRQDFPTRLPMWSRILVFRLGMMILWTASSQTSPVH